MALLWFAWLHVGQPSVPAVCLADGPGGILSCISAQSIINYYIQTQSQYYYYMYYYM